MPTSIAGNQTHAVQAATQIFRDFYAVRIPLRAFTVTGNGHSRNDFAVPFGCQPNFCDPSISGGNGYRIISAGVNFQLSPDIVESISGLTHFIAVDCCGTTFEPNSGQFLLPKFTPHIAQVSVPLPPSVVNLALAYGLLGLLLASKRPLDS